MADEVRKQMESMVPELEDLQERELMNAREIRMVVKQRREFEYLLKRRSPRKVDFLRYIAFELNFESLRQKRKARLKQASKGVSDHAGMRRVHLIFDRALRRFHADTALWLQYMSFCARTRSTKTLARLFPRALRTHPREAAIWIRAASWEFVTNSNIEAARVMLQRGLRVNKSSARLWVEYFRFEMLCVEKLVARRQLLGLAEGEGEGEESGVARALRGGAVPLVVVRNALAARAEDLDFQLELLEVCDSFRLPAAEHVGAALVAHLKTTWAAEPRCWAALATRPLRLWRAEELERDAAAKIEAKRSRKRKRKAAAAAGEGAIADNELAAPTAAGKAKSGRSKRAAAAERQCVALFEGAVVVVSGEGGEFAAAALSGVWEAYAAWAMERLAGEGGGSSSSSSSSRRRRSGERAAWLSSTLSSALHRSAALSPALATQHVWTLLSTGHGPAAFIAAAEATRLFPLSAAVWAARIAVVRRCEALAPPSAAAAAAVDWRALCEAALVAVPNADAGEVWALYLDWAIAEARAGEEAHAAVAALFERAIRTSCGASTQAPAAQALAYQYLAWAWIGGAAHGKAATDRVLALDSASANIVGRRGWSYVLRCEALAAAAAVADPAGAQQRVRALFERAVRQDRDRIDRVAVFEQFAAFAEAAEDYELAANVRWRASQE